VEEVSLSSSNILDGVVELVVFNEGDSISNSFNTLAFATSAKRPERKSELYEERFTGDTFSLSLIIIVLAAKARFFRNAKRTFLDDAVVMSTAILFGGPMVVVVVAVEDS